jgi:hypothetical protein
VVETVQGVDQGMTGGQCLRLNGEFPSVRCIAIYGIFPGYLLVQLEKSPDHSNRAMSIGTVLCHTLEWSLCRVQEAGGTCQSFFL